MAQFLVIVLLVASVWVLWNLRRGGETSSTSAGQRASARLQELSAALHKVGEASSHPRDLAANPTFREATALLVSPQVPLDVVLDHATGANWMLSTVAFAALCDRTDRDQATQQIVRSFRSSYPWPLYYALRCVMRLQERPPIGTLLLHCPEYWIENGHVPNILTEHFKAREEAGDTPGFGDALSSASGENRANVEALLGKIEHPWAQTLKEAVLAAKRQTLDREFLQGFGRFVERDAAHDLLIEHDAIKEQLAVAEAVVLNDRSRSLLVVGEPRSGKTTFLMLLAARAAAQGWTIFEASAASLMAGQTYFGQLEERLRRLPAELAIEKRVIWYVPDFLQLATGGTHTAQSATILDQLLPAIAAGRLAVISELTGAALTTILQQRPSLRSAVELVRLRALSDSDCDRLAREFVTRLATLSRVEIAADVTDSALHLTRHYVGSDQMPGAVLDLIKMTGQRVAAHDGTRIRREDLLLTLSQVTGMPALVLDDRERIELASIRRFFTSRVIGQEEAVDVVVDRIAMLKAGLTDSTKPIAVFLFAGPTGTGKTELAKTLAEFLFGSPERLIRLDMSEFQAVESTRKILGEADAATESQALTHRVRKQPFSVVLLDEFEKAHPNTWDLFLQVFDDGRLTDAKGQTADFRHCIIILTSNLGSTLQQHASPGFSQVGGRFSQEHVMRTVNQSFRPEFVNRLDAIIVFRPLTRELMRGILAKELARVLERRGLRDREWAVEWESSALDFLLDKGFSPTMGARPLKRAIDRFLLAPLAGTLVEHRFPEGDQFLFVRSDGRAIQVEFVDPDAPDEPPPLHEPEPAIACSLTTARMTLRATGTAEERASLVAALEAIDATLASARWTSIEHGLVDEMQRPDFWTRSERFAVLSRFALIDRVKAAVVTARGFEARLNRSTGDGGRVSRDLTSRLALQLYTIQHGIDDVFSNAAVEVVLVVQPLLDAGADPAATARWSERVIEMYRRWAARRHMLWEDVPSASLPSLAIVSGFGAARILAGEAGLHTLEYPGSHDELLRVVARVRVAPTPAVLPDDGAAKHASLMAELNRTSANAAVVRRYRLDSSPLIRDGVRGWRTGRPDLVLDGNFDLLADTMAQ